MPTQPQRPQEHLSELAEETLARHGLGSMLVRIGTEIGSDLVQTLWCAQLLEIIRTGAELY